MKPIPEEKKLHQIESKMILVQVKRRHLQEDYEKLAVERLSLLTIINDAIKKSKEMKQK